MAIVKSIIIVAISLNTSVIINWLEILFMGNNNPAGMMIILKYTTTALSRYPMAMLNKRSISNNFKFILIINLYLAEILWFN